MLAVHGVPVEDTFAEAFSMTAARVIVTAATAGWAETGARCATGYAASVIGCDAEAGVERALEMVRLDGMGARRVDQLSAELRRVRGGQPAAPADDGRVAELEDTIH